MAAAPRPTLVVVRRKDWAGTVIVTCLVGAAGLLRDHTLALVLLLTTAAVGAIVIAWDVVRRRASTRAAGTLRVLAPSSLRVPRSTSAASPRTFADRMRPHREAELRKLRAEERKAREHDGGTWATLAECPARSPSIGASFAAPRK
jgi:hypothetical protein